MRFEDEPVPGYPLPILPGHTSPGRFERVLRAGGFTPARAVAAYRLVASYTRGYALAEIAGFALEEGTIAERFPTVRSLARQLTSEPGQGSFRAGLETIITGLRNEREP